MQVLDQADGKNIFIIYSETDSASDEDNLQVIEIMFNPFLRANEQ